MLQRQRAVMWAAGCLVLLSVALLGISELRGPGPITYREALGSQNPLERQVSAAFERNYTGGLVLAQAFGNEGLVFHIPSNQLVYEGSYRQWQPALRSPSANHIQWIVTRCGSNADKVCATVNAGEFAQYQLVWQSADDAYRIYEFKEQFLASGGHK